MKGVKNAWTSHKNIFLALIIGLLLLCIGAVLFVAIPRDNKTGDSATSKDLEFNISIPSPSEGTSIYYSVFIDYVDGDGNIKRESFPHITAYTQTKLSMQIDSFYCVSAYVSVPLGGSFTSNQIYFDLMESIGAYANNYYNVLNFWGQIRFNYALVNIDLGGRDAWDISFNIGNQLRSNASTDYSNLDGSENYVNVEGVVSTGSYNSYTVSTGTPITLTPKSQSNMVFDGFYLNGTYESSLSFTHYYNIDEIQPKPSQFIKNGQSITYYPSGGVTSSVYARWTSGATITLDQQNGSGGTTSVVAPFGGTLPSITPPTRKGYTFQGYFTNTSGQGTKYYNADGSGAITCPNSPATKLYASWKQVDFDITLDRQNGSGGEANVKVTIEEALPSIIPPTRTDYLFQGYYTIANGKGTKYYNADGTPALSSCPTNPPTTLYAYWVKDNWGNHYADSFASGTGSETSPYLISTPEQLARVAYLTNDYEWEDNNGDGFPDEPEFVYYKQIANIDLSRFLWSPIGSVGEMNDPDGFFWPDHPFVGSYDGGGYKISGLTIDTDQSFQGLFSITGENAVIKNVNVIGANIKAQDYVGALVGFMYSDATIEYCKVIDTQIQANNYVGGVIGEGSGTIQYVSSNNVGIGNYICAGGIVGRLTSGSLLLSEANGVKIRAYTTAGGLAGYSVGKIDRCIVSGGSEIGTNFRGAAGFVSYLGGTYGLSNCYLVDSISIDLDFNCGIFAYETSLQVPIYACAYIGKLLIERDWYFCPDTNAKITACYATDTVTKIYSTALTSTDWTNNWAIVPGMNNNLPVNKNLFTLASIIQSTSAEIQSALSGYVLKQ